MNSSTFQIHLITGLTTNEALFYSVVLENASSGNVLQTAYLHLLPYISRVSLNKIKKNLIARGFLSQDIVPLVDPISLPEPIRKDMVYTTMGRPSNTYNKK